MILSSDSSSPTWAIGLIGKEGSAKVVLLLFPTVNEFAIYQNFQITSLKRDGHSAKLTCGKSVDADLNAAYNMIRILKPQMSITLGSNTYNLKQKIV